MKQLGKRTRRSALLVVAALSVDEAQWRRELRGIDEWLDKIGGTVPTALHDELESLRQRLS